MKAVIQSGGKGTRLRPYTMVLPKPLMPVGTKPVLELLLRWLRRSGVLQTYVTTGYLGHLIRSYCGDGGQWDLQINYTEETEPLGTVGALSLLRKELDSTFLMINGDVLADLNLNAFVAHHRRYEGPLTIATVRRTVQIDFGILESQNARVVGFKEKPTLTQNVSTGIYCMEPQVLNYIPSGVPFGFDDLMYCLMDKEQPIHTYQHNGLWLDIGRIEDFQKAQQMAWDEEPHAVESVLPAFDTFLVG
jgi:NDP-sugar pyrophosphorylase family protein